MPHHSAGPQELPLHSRDYSQVAHKHTLTPIFAHRVTIKGLNQQARKRVRFCCQSLVNERNQPQVSMDAYGRRDRLSLKFPPAGWQRNKMPALTHRGLHNKTSHGLGGQKRHSAIYCTWMRVGTQVARAVACHEPRCACRRGTLHGCRRPCSPVRLLPGVVSTTFRGEKTFSRAKRSPPPICRSDAADQPLVVLSQLTRSAALQ